MSRERFFWTHGSFEKERHGLYWRRWFYFGPKVCISYDFYLFGRHAGIDLRRGSRSLTLFIGIPYIFSFWLKLGGILPHGERRKIGISFFGGSLWWNVWIDEDVWSSKDSKWRRGSFNFADFFLGKHKYSSIVVESRPITIPMPERLYTGTATLTDDSWTRKRGFTKTIRRCTIEVPEGVPHEGKGENSWDCGTDATFSSTFAAKDIPSAVGHFIGSCLQTRIKYGGWKDWEFRRFHPDGCPDVRNAGDGHSFLPGCEKYAAAMGMPPQKAV